MKVSARPLPLSNQAKTQYIKHTFGSQVLCSLQIVHRLERLGLFFGKLLFVIIFARPRYPVEEDAACLRVPEVVNNGGDDEAYSRSAKDGKDADHDSLCRGSEAVVGSCCVRDDIVLDAVVCEGCWLHGWEIVARVVRRVERRRGPVRVEGLLGQHCKGLAK